MGRDGFLGEAARRQSRHGIGVDAEKAAVPDLAEERSFRFYGMGGEAGPVAKTAAVPNTPSITMRTRMLPTVTTNSPA